MREPRWVSRGVADDQRVSTQSQVFMWWLS